MKTTDLIKGRSYEDKDGKVKRMIRQIVKPEGDHRLHVYFGEDGRVKNIPIQEFAKWAARKVN